MFACLRSRMYVRLRLVILCLLSLITVCPAFGQSAPIFPTLGSYTISTATAFATGDFNGDGKTDLVYLGLPASGITTVNVLLYQGPTTDPIAVTPNPVSCTAVASVAAVDINKDGKLDAVLACTQGLVVELYGNGDGTFQAPVTTLLSGPAASFTTGDFNADGYLDLAVILNNGTYSVTTLLNQGGASAGTLTVAGTRSLTSAVSTMKTGDFNGDGKSDVILEGPRNLYVVLGNGDGTFQAQQSFPGNGAFEVGDFNNDGITDVACVSSDFADPQTYSLQVILGTSSGQFAVASSLVVPDSSVPVAIGKNGDGNTDLAVVGSATTIMFGSGNGTFSAGQSYAVSGTPIVVNPDDNGKVSLSFYTNSGVTPTIQYLPANGDGTFQGPPTQRVGTLGFVTADLNGDGIADTAYFDSKSNLVVALGRGNGTFTVTNQISATGLTLLVPADFDADGKIDLIGIRPGNGTGHGNTVLINSQVFFYKGNGDGTLTAPSGSPAEIAIFGPPGPIQAAAADFNGDNKLDVVIGYYNMTDSAPTGVGYIFLAGRGDGTFTPSAPVSGGGSGFPLLLGDMNRDNKLDLVWGPNVYLSNGDGTFTLFPIAVSPIALGDLNGDGILDVVTKTAIYAGLGNGGVQSSSFASFTTSNAAVVGDVNADGHPDFVTQYEIGASPYIDAFTVYLGDGAGHFTDGGTSVAGSHPVPSAGPGYLFLTRLNNQAPVGSADHALDLLALTSGGATSLINQTNPPPGQLAPISSHVSVSASPSSAGINQQFTFTVLVTGATPTGTLTLKSGSTTLATKTLTGGSATLTASFAAAGTYAVTAIYSGDSSNLTSVSSPVSVTVTPSSTTTTLSASSANANQAQAITYTATVTGVNPTGTVTFKSGTTTLGTGTVTNGVATLSASFATAGSYSVTASYSGDSNNQPSTSSVQAITVVAPDYTLTANPAAATVKAGQSATFAINMTSVGGYSGTVKLSCGSLPAEATCTFSPATLTGSGTSANSTLTITTTAPTAMLERPGSSSSRIAVWAVLLGLCLSPRRVLRSRRHLARIMAMLLLTMGSLIYLTGCGGSSSTSSTPRDSGTPTGAQTIAVAGADSASGPSHSLNLQLTVQ